MQSCIIVDDKEVKRIIPSVTREFALYTRVYVCSLKILEKMICSSFNIQYQSSKCMQCHIIPYGKFQSITFQKQIQANI